MRLKLCHLLVVDIGVGMITNLGPLWSFFS